MKHFKSNSLDIFGRAMKRRYEVSYYEYGLTLRKTKKFFFGFSALIYSLWIKIIYGYESYVRLYEYEDNSD